LLVGEHLCDVVMMLDRGFLLSVMGWDRGAAVPALGLALGGASLGTVGSAGGVLLLGVVGGLCASVLQICAGGVDVARQRSPPLPEVLGIGARPAGRAHGGVDPAPSLTERACAP